MEGGNAHVEVEVDESLYFGSSRCWKSRDKATSVVGGHAQSFGMDKRRTEPRSSGCGLNGDRKLITTGFIVLHVVDAEDEK